MQLLSTEAVDWLWQNAVCRWRGAFPLHYARHAPKTEFERDLQKPSSQRRRGRRKGPTFPMCCSRQAVVTFLY